jgi:hypothetical protein
MHKISAKRRSLEWKALPLDGRSLGGLDPAVYAGSMSRFI